MADTSTNKRRKLSHSFTTRHANIPLPQMMFKLIFPPPQLSMSNREFLQHVKEYVHSFIQYIKLHLKTVKDFKILQIVKERSVPRFTDLEVEIKAVHLNGESGLYSIYQSLCKKWMDLSEKWITWHGWNKSIPLLMISDQKAFQRSSQATHLHVPVTDVAFGILPFPSEFISFVSLKNLPAVSFGGKVDFYHDQSKVDIPVTYGACTWVVTFSYQNIRRILIDITKNASIDLYLDLLHPPLLFEIEQRQSRFIGPYEIKKRKLDISDLTKDIIGGANILKFTLIENDELSFNIINRLHYRCCDIPVYYSHVHQSTMASNNSYSPNPLIYLPNFGCKYLFTAIWQRNFSTTEQCNRFRIKELNDCMKSVEAKHIEKALTKILFAIDSGKCVYFPLALISLSTYYSQNVEKSNFSDYIVPEKSRLIRRVTITPTRLLLWPPEIMFENRVLRNYDPEFALRINFRDDDMSRLSWKALHADESIFDSAIKSPMLNGMKIGDRNYEFLGWSNSQIRDHGVWCYATDNLGYSVQDIRKWMGDFSNIKSISKYMARVGQSFSQTEDSISVPLSSDHVRFEMDITGGLDRATSKPYCFSDGIGKISVKLADEVHQVLGHDKHCSAFQIRYGGCKGMLVIDPTLKDVKIVFRDSMKKFDSPQNTSLEICKTSSPIPLHLNRPFITLLDQMGVATRILLQLQEDHLRILSDILLDEEKAVNYLKEKCPLNILNFEELSKSGIELTVEPFFKQLLLSLHMFHIGKIKTHANIAIDPSEGRNMFGVLDETATLEYGQVFIQYSKDILLGETTTDTIIVTGTVLVTKNPCHHPGDVRKFEAVDIPALHHIVDCIVFPQKGHRSHPNEMAGSDLDGDEYYVIWKKELIFSKQNAEPGNYPSFQPPEKENIMDRDVIDFLVEYIKNDQVGVISNAHLAQADRSGIHSRECLNIAEKFSVAVDYAKNGTKRELSMDERPKQYPDFMEKSYKATYKSDKALGKLFRVCKDFERSNVTASLQAPVVEVDPLLIYPGWEKYKLEAERSRDKYISLLLQIQETYGVQHETEAFSGAYSQVHCRFQERKDRAEVEKVVNASIKALCKNMKLEFISQVHENAHDVSLLSKRPDLVSCLLQKASAWYMVTYSNPEIGILSFPWIVSNFLADIKIQKIYPKISTGIRMPIVNRINSIIYSNLQAIPALTSEGTEELESHKFLEQFDRDVVEIALRVMMMWAVNAHIIQVEGCSNRGFLYRKVFAQLFLHVIERETNTAKPSVSKPNFNHGESQKSAAAYCLAFLRFCVSLRFCNKNDVKQLLPFQVYKYKVLASQAMICFHDIAITGAFSILDFDEERTDGLIEMKQEYIDVSDFGSVHLSTEFLSGVKGKLEEQSGVQELSLREYHSTKKVIVSAIGTNYSILHLKRILRKGNALNNIVQSVKSELISDIPDSESYFDIPDSGSDFDIPDSGSDFDIPDCESDFDIPDSESYFDNDLFPSDSDSNPFF